MTVRVAFIGDSHLAPLAKAARAMNTGRLQPTFFADILRRLRHLQVADGCLYPGNDGQKKILVETSGGIACIDPASYDLFIMMGLEFEFPYESLCRHYYSRAVVEQATVDHMSNSLAMKTLLKLRRVTNRPVWLLHKPLFAPNHLKLRLDVMTYDRFLALAEEVFRPLEALVIPQPGETCVGECFSLSEFSRNPVSIDNQTGETGRVTPDNHHKNELFGQILVRDIRSRLESFRTDSQPDVGSWRPQHSGVIQDSRGEELLLRLDDQEGIKLDRTAAIIWKYCDGSRTREEILTLLSERYSLSVDRIWPDLRQTLTTLVECGALKPGPKYHMGQRLQSGSMDSLKIKSLAELPDIRFCCHDNESSITDRFKQAINGMELRNVFNPSFLEKDDLNVFAFRAIPNDSDQLTSYVSIQSANNRSIHMISEDHFEHLKVPRLIDPKVFTAGDSVYLTFNTGWVKSGNDIFVMKIFPELENPRKVVYANRRRQERNWGFFSEQGEVFAIYQVAPLVILKLEQETDDCWHMTEVSRKPVVDIPSDLTIGTQPFKYQDRYYFMAHRKYFLNNKKVYLGRLCSLDPGSMNVASDRTWMAHSPDSLGGTEPRHNTNLHSCTYFSGLQITDSVVTLGYGVNDVDFGFSACLLEERFV